MISFFNKLSKTNERKLIILLTVANVLLMASLNYLNTPLKNGICKTGIVSYELAKDLNLSKDIINSWSESAKIFAGISLGLDFLFLLVYTTLIALLIYKINNRLWKNSSINKVGVFLIIAIFFAGLFDAIENFALIKLLLGDLKQHWSSIAYYFAFVKFVIVLSCIVFILIGWLGLLTKKMFLTKKV